MKTSTLIVSGILCLFAAQGCKKKSKEESGKTVTVLIAAESIGPRTPLTLDLINHMEIPLKYYDDRMLTPKHVEENRGRLIIHQINKGGRIFFHNLESESVVSMSRRLRPGGRAYPLEIAGESIEKWIKKATHVDLTLSFHIEFEGFKKLVTLNLLENLVVLDKNKRCVRLAKERTCTTDLLLLLLPEEVTLLHHARQLGPISVSIRNPDDRGLQAGVKALSLKELLAQKQVTLDQVKAGGFGVIKKATWPEAHWDKEGKNLSPNALREKRVKTLDTIRILKGMK
ncbi:hypothetical protein KKF84_19715 [Myxococcota bacterium]|nr:hypothetical protein [Myxococcota bacterium]